jgi:ABC-type multidrug transport system permease subunit
VTAYVSRFEDFLWSIAHYIVAAALALALAFSSFAFVPSGKTLDGGMVSITVKDLPA